LEKLGKKIITHHNLASKIKKTIIVIMRELRSHSPDKTFLFLAGAILFIGLAFLSSSSTPLAQTKFNDPYYFLKHQIVFGLIPGIIGFLFAYFFYYRKWFKISAFLFLFSLILLALVFTPLGITKKGATRWINIFGFSFQPSEIAKMFFIIYLASWLSSEKRKKFFSGYIPFLIICSLFAFLLIKEPATGMAVLIFSTALLLYFLSQGRVAYILLTVILGTFLVGYLIVSTPYRWHRFQAFLNPESDPLGYSYQIKQNLIALGSGGLTGRGFGKSLLKEKFIPEVIGDSIFAVIGEETGFIGASALILLYLLLFLRGLKIACRAPDDFSKLLVSGFSILLTLQAFINISSVISIIPFTGLPLPLISYGGTSLAVSLTMIGIIANVSKYTKKI